MNFIIKKFLAWILNFLGILDWKLQRLNKHLNNKYIRIINYHDTMIVDQEMFEYQLAWYKKHFINVDYKLFQNFLCNGELPYSKPGIMLTFDDGLKGNFIVARKLLKKYGFTGYFMCSSDLVGTSNYMSYDNLKILVNEGHIIADHTATHHRMNINDTKELLKNEIYYSKKKLEAELKIPIEIFCWCGGEEKHYTKSAYDYIKEAGYKYGFMTNSKPVIQGDNPYNIQRINVESGWPIYLTKFQVSGIMDERFRRKRKRINKLME